MLLLTSCVLSNRYEINEYKISRKRSSSLNLSSIFESLTYVNLDATPQNAMIGSIERIKTNRDYLMIVHRKSSLREISVFTSSGSLVQNYNIIFKSPYNKYLSSITDGCFTSKDTTIYIYDILKNRINEFDFKGNYLSHMASEFIVQQIYASNKHLFIYSGLSGDMNNGYSIHVKNTANKIKDFYKIPDFLLENRRISLNLSINNNEYIYHENFDNNIYIYSDDNFRKLASISYDGFFDEEDIEMVKKLAIDNRTEFINNKIIYDNKYPGFQVVHFHNPYIISKIHDNWLLINTHNRKTILVNKWINDLDSSTLGELETWPIWYDGTYLYFFLYKENFSDELMKTNFNENLIVVKAKLKTKILELE